MALTTGEYHIISILPSSDPAWAGLPSYPHMPAQIIDHQANGTSFMVYCIDAPTGQLAFDGGQVFGLVDALLAAVGAVLPRLAVVDTNAQTTQWGQDGAGPVYTYTGSSGILTKYAGGPMAALKAWLP